MTILGRQACNQRCTLRTNLMNTIIEYNAVLGVAPLLLFIMPLRIRLALRKDVFYHTVVKVVVYLALSNIFQ